jgi:3-oxoacyl-[acyl-carrier protein] reductase
MKNILLTGVSRGVGLVITKKLLENGFNVYGISRSDNEEIKKLKNHYSNKFFFLSFDLSEVEHIYSKVFKEFIPLSIPLYGFVNNAAFAYDDIITNAEYKRLKLSFDVNFFSSVMLTKYVIRNMLFNNLSGSIVHMSSISVHTGYKGLSMYAASKGAVEALSKNIAREWGEKKIRSNCIVAGFMETDMSSKLSKEQKERIYQRTSLKQATDLDSVAETVLFLLSNKSKSITGQNIFVDSGTI